MTETVDRFFERLEVQDWRQFEAVDIRFRRRLTVLTGANGSGKTTLLNLLSRHFGWSLPFIAAPTSRSGRAVQYLAERRKRSETIRQTGEAEVIGSLSYSDGSTSDLLATASDYPTYEVYFSTASDVAGLFITAQRPTTWYEQVQSIPTQVTALDAVLEQYLNDYRSRYYRSNTPPPSFRIKEALVSWATFGPGNRLVAPNSLALAALEGFTKILRLVLPNSLGFQQLKVVLPEVVLETSSGNIAFDSVSGGIAALIDMSWQVYLYSLVRRSFTVLIDEPENHLHPELQRTVLPAFMRAFPRQRFIVATHNPLVVGSVEDSAVYVLRPGRSHGIRSGLLKRGTTAGTANEILRDVLGVSTSIPVWAENEVNALISKLDANELGPDDAEHLRRELARLGLSDLMPYALDRWLADREH